MTGDPGTDGPGRRRRRSGRRRRLRPGARRLILLVLLGVAGVVIWGAVWYQGQVDAGPAGPAVIIKVPEGSSVSAITATLAQQQVVGSSLAFRIYLTLHGSPTLQAGRYQLHRHEAFGTVRDTLAAGPNIFAVRILPGTTVAETARAVGNFVPGHDAATFLHTATSGAVHSTWQPAGSDNLDGLLAPGTYLVKPGESDATLLQDMIGRFDKAMASAGLTTAAAADQITPYEAITVASIVQKEAISPGDSAKATEHNAGPVARVIYNRLDRGTPLQMDSTVLYAEGRDGGPVTSADLAMVTPYNTYLNAGLTPTPICFPSALALQAALHPPAGNWLYFELTSADGTETFSTTFAGQMAAEALARSRGLP